MQRLFQTIVLIMFTGAVAGCGSMFPPLAVEQQGEGDLYISVRSAALLPQSGGTLRVDLYTVAKPASDDKPTIIHEAPLHSFGGGVHFRNIATRNWYVHVRVMDDEGIPVFEGAGSAAIRNGETSRVALELHPVPGKLVVNIDLGDECIHVEYDPPCLHEAKRPGQLVVNKGLEADEIKYAFEWPEGETRLTLPARQLPPGTYDFRVSFYKGSRIPKHELIGATRYGLDIRSGRTTTVTWRPDSGDLDLELAVLSPPGPPDNVTLSTEPDGSSVLHWTAPPEPVLHYVIYVKGFDSDWFCHITETPDTYHRFKSNGPLYCYGKERHPVEPELYVVTAVGPGGYESRRSGAVASAPQHAAE